jgi:N-acetylmuramoyl-L-alanine amidase-like protein
VAVSMVLVFLGLAWASAALVQPVWRRAAAPQPRFAALPRPSQKFEPVPGRVWLVEATDRFELYSNGLQVENQFQTSTQPRAYLSLSREGMETRPARLCFDPAGIVFHTTESHMAPFEEDQNGTLRRAGEGLLEFVRRNHSYHFVIDRFGRVFRVVREGDYANHAGHSVWADQNWIYLNLNQSFFGLAFEATSRPGDGPPVNAAQVHAGRILVEMLRARYKISAANCVAHAQVSINPTNRRAGYHTDWAANLPFHDLGLSDNYLRPLPSVTLFGFTAEELRTDGDALGPALQAGDDLVRRDAAARGMSLERYREVLQRRYRDAIASVGRQTNVKYKY